MRGNIGWKNNLPRWTREEGLIHDDDDDDDDESLNKEKMMMMMMMNPLIRPYFPGWEWHWGGGALR